MAMTIGILGRERTRKIICFALFHIAGAICGGIMIGGFLGIIGQLLSLWRWHTEILLTIGITAFWLSIKRQPSKLGLQRQVPRTWMRVMVPELCYTLWGLLLGSGIATVIPYSAFLVLLTTQLTSGFAFGCLSGAIFGGGRQLIAILPLVRKRYRMHPEDVGMLMPFLTKPISVLNTLWIIASIILVIIFR